ncbi:RidA family protein [Cryobacterium sp. PH31-O1]|uniref:RidA family protein n=1 Tax=Cryobacterium sp. PH31-O1 TaxID=3046306 RepID=UPI0024BA4356|nr:RidA family protein [Cryobacterium sp. PH31-O1]MDJ0338999.1 RidA family protein [Cryobacterium sp. PH31-O1]
MTIARIPPIGPPNPSALASGGTAYGGLVYTTQIPRRPDGSIELGEMSLQAEQTLQNLQKALTSLGSGLSKLMHLTIYVTNIADLPAFNEVYARLVPRPYPSRCAIGVQGLAVDGMRVEVTAVAVAVTI